MAKDFENKVERYIEGIEKIKREKEEIQRKEEKIYDFERKLKSSRQDLMRELKNPQLPESETVDEILKYVFLNYEDNTREALQSVREFVSDLEAMANQKFLLWNSSGHWSSTALRRDGRGLQEGKIEEKMIISRLNNPSYEIDGQTMKLNYDGAYEFTKSNGFRKTEKRISIDSFVKKRVKPFQNSGYGLPLEKLLEICPEVEVPEELPGLQINLPAPIYTKENMPIGRHSTYDNPVMSRLIIGNERVEDFLQNYDLKCTEKRTYIPEIPSI